MNEKDLDTAIEKCERIMEFDIRTMQNPVSENGWIFEKVYELLQYLRGLQFAADTNVATTDIISRAAVVDAIEGVDWYHMTDSGEMVHGANSAEHQAWYKAEDIYAAIEALPSAQRGWIPCDRELPKPNEEDGNGFYKAYLVQDGRWMDVARWDGKYWIAWGYSTVLLNVVAWMPLPAPYIPEGDDKHEG